MKKYIILTVMILFLMPKESFNQNKKCLLSNTKWVYKWNATVADYFIFKEDSTFIQYSAEIDNIYFGNYYYSNDTIFASIDSAKYMHDFNASYIKLIFNLDTLRFIYAKYGYAKPTTVFDKKYYFLKAKSTDSPAGRSL